MTARTIQEINLICDKCGREMPGGHRPNVSEARASARNFGWCYVSHVDRHYDFCGKCAVEALVKPREPSSTPPDGNATSDPVAAIRAAIDDEHRRIDRVKRGYGPGGLLNDGIVADAKYAVRALNRALMLAGQSSHREVE